MIFRAPALTARVERASERASNAEENHWLVINTTTPVSQDNALSENHEEYINFRQCPFRIYLVLSTRTLSRVCQFFSNSGNLKYTIGSTRCEG
ncbi:hypothetical protein V1478_014057, partial [Vespula squamosa]